MPTSMNTKTATIRFGAIAVSANGECLEYLLVCKLWNPQNFGLVPKKEFLSLELS